MTPAPDDDAANESDIDEIARALNEEDEMMCEVYEDGEDEALIAKPLRKPGEPSDQERREHNITHWPARIWCKHCVEGRGLHDHHTVSKEPPSDEVPTVSIDYCFMGSSSVGAQDNPVLIVYDHRTRATGAYMTGNKGPVDWVIKAVCGDLETWGYGSCRIAIKSDQENSIKSLREAIAQSRSAPTAIIHSPVRESKSNGAVEKAVQRWQSQYRTMKLALEEKLQRTISVKGKISAWLTSWAAVTLNRFAIGKDGRTSYQLIHGHKCQRPVALFGEMVHYKQSGDHKDKGDTIWGEGVFLGMNARSIDSIISTKNGIESVRTVRARPESESWNTDAISKVPSVAEFIGIDDGRSSGPEELHPRNPGTENEVINNGEDDNGSDLDVEAIQSPGTPTSAPSYAPTSPAAGSPMVMPDLDGHSGLPPPDQSGIEEARDSASIPQQNEEDHDPSQFQRLRRISPDSVHDDTLLNLLKEMKCYEHEISQIVEEDKNILKKILLGVDITEVYSRPRIVQMGTSMGLIGGDSFDNRN